MTLSMYLPQRLICSSRIQNLQPQEVFLVIWPCYEKLICSYDIIFPLVSQGELFSLFSLSVAFLHVTPSQGVTFKPVSENNIRCTTLSAITFALSFDSPLPVPALQHR